MQAGKRGIRARLLAAIMAKGGPVHEGMVREHKERLFPLASGSVLEIGAGIGPNLRYLPPVAEYVACEPNAYMHGRLRDEMARYGIAGSIDPRPAEQLLRDTPESAVDTVICTLVLCSVARPEELLADILRVLKPGGRLLLLEHVAAPRGSALRVCQHLLSPLFRCFADGCRPYRDTLRTLHETGFSRIYAEEFHLPLGPVAPHICGWAEK